MIEVVARLPLWGSWSVCTCQHHVPWEIVIHETWCWLWQAHTLLFLFSLILFYFFNCTLQNMRIIVEYSVIVGRSLVWLKTNLNPTMTILLFSSILSTKRQWQSSTSTRPVWQRQKSVMSRMQSTDHEEAIFDRQRGNIKMVNWPDCGGQRVSRLWQPESATSSTIDRAVALQSACPATLYS